MLQKPEYRPLQTTPSSFFEFEIIIKTFIRQNEKFHGFLRIIKLNSMKRIQGFLFAFFGNEISARYKILLRCEAYDISRIYLIGYSLGDPDSRTKSFCPSCELFIPLAKMCIGSRTYTTFLYIPRVLLNFNNYFKYFNCFRGRAY